MPNNSLDFALLEFSGSVTKTSGSLQAGQYSTSSAAYSYSEGFNNTAVGIGAKAEGSMTTAIGNYSHTEGLGTVTLGDYQHAYGKYNLPISDDSAIIVGNGTSNANRSNLFVISPSTNTIQVSGSLDISGSLAASDFVFSVDLMVFGGAINTSRCLPLWRAPISCSITKMYGTSTGVSGVATVLPKKSVLGSLSNVQNHIASPKAPVDYVGTLYELGTILNASYAPGDVLYCDFTSSALPSLSHQKTLIHIDFKAL